LSAGNAIILQEFEQWTTKERQDFISCLLAGSLFNDQVDWVNVGVDPQHLDDRNGYEDAASYPGKLFQTMDEIPIYHDSQVARNHLEKPQKFPIYLFGEVHINLKAIRACHLVNHESLAVYP
jgi:hypothetical protein